MSPSRTLSKIFILLAALCTTLGGLSMITAPVSAQRLTPTPVSIDLPQIQVESQPGVQQETVFSSPTPPITPTEDLSISLEANPDIGPANVYSLPQLDSEALDPIPVGARYPITGRYYNWLQFSYDKSLTGFGWVYDAGLIITGSGTIPDFDPYMTPTATPMGGDLSGTREAITLTPGAVETFDAQARVIAAPGVNATEESGEPQVLPTFTQPAEGARGVSGAARQGGSNSFEETLSRAANGQLPPLVPILILAAAGLLGMIVSLWRR